MVVNCQIAHFDLMVLLFIYNVVNNALFQDIANINTNFLRYTNTNGFTTQSLHENSRSLLWEWSSVFANDL